MFPKESGIYADNFSIGLPDVNFMKKRNDYGAGCFVGNYNNSKSKEYIAQERIADINPEPNMNLEIPSAVQNNYKLNYSSGIDINIPASKRKKEGDNLQYGENQQNEPVRNNECQIEDYNNEKYNEKEYNKKLLKNELRRMPENPSEDYTPKKYDALIVHHNKYMHHGDNPAKYIPND